MAERNFKAELDLVIEQFERDTAQLERAWEAFRARGTERCEIANADLAELEDACRIPTPRGAPAVGSVRC